MPGAFERENVGALLDDAEQRDIARGVSTEATPGVAAGEKSADIAERDVLRGDCEGGSERGGGALW